MTHCHTKPILGKNIEEFLAPAEGPVQTKALGFIDQR